MPRDNATAKADSLANIEAEQALLGALLLNNEVLDRLPAGFDGEVFYEPVHARVYETARYLIARGRHVSPVTLKDYFALDPALNDLGGFRYLANLASSAISVAAARDYADTLRDLWARRRAVVSLEGALEHLRGGLGDGTTDAIEQAQATLASVAWALSPKPLFTTLGKALDDAATRTNAAYQNEGVPLLSTGLRNLDAVTGGFIPADHWVLMGESSMGKTALALSLAWNVMRQGKGVFFGSLEMPAQQLAHRLASNVMAERGSRVLYNHLITGNLTEEAFRLFLETGNEIQSGPLIFAEDDAASLPKLEAAAHAAQRHFARTDTPLGLVLIDFLQLVKVPGSRGRTEEVGAAAMGMKTLAKTLAQECECAVVSLSQMNQDNKHRDSKRPTKGDARQSGEIEQSADLMIGMYREAYYLQRDAEALRGVQDKQDQRSIKLSDLERRRNELELILLKNRRGDTSTVFEWVDLPVNRVADEPPDGPSGQEKMDFA